MNQYIKGWTDDHGDIGMVRNEDYGYYTQMQHGGGFFHGELSGRFYKKEYRGGIVIFPVRKMYQNMGQN